jgi:hypothetical protein
VTYCHGLFLVETGVCPKVLVLKMRVFGALLVLFICVMTVSAFRSSHHAPLRMVSTHTTPSSATLSMSQKRGKHGEDFKFLPAIKLDKDEYWPQILQIAGIYPQCSYNELMAIGQQDCPAPPQGYWAYDFSDPSGPQMGLVAIPGSNRLASCVDPVVLITPSSALGYKGDEDTEMMVVIDRGDITKLQESEFFVFRNPDDSLSINWCEGEPNMMGDCVGKVALCCTPLTAKMREKSGSGFGEVGNEDF